MTAYVSVQAVPKMRVAMEDGVDRLVSLYPADLRLMMDFDTNELSTEGVKEPVIIPITAVSELENNVQVNPDVKNLLVIDTSASIEDFLEYQTMMLATKKELVVLADQQASRYQVIPYSELGANGQPIQTSTGGELKSFTVDKNLLVNGAPELKAFLDKLARMAPWFIFLGVYIFLLVSRMIYLLFMSVLVMILGSLTGRKLAYGKSYQLGMHAVTISDLVTKVQFLLYPTVFPFLFSLAFLGTSLIALMGIKKRK